MGKTTHIQWAQSTWNPWHGCHKVDAGCANCYMYRGKKRFGLDPTKVVRSKPATFNAPLRWKEPRRIFVCSWSDFFIEEADEWRRDAWNIIWQTEHTYMILTKRSERALDPCVLWPHNTWVGVSVSQIGDLWRIDQLRWIEAQVQFVSVEPMLAPLHLNLNGIDWVICGCESGPGRRPFNEDWARNLRDQCVAAHVPFFYKQGRDEQNRVVSMPELDGKVWAEFPPAHKENQNG